MSAGQEDYPIPCFSYANAANDLFAAIAHIQCN